MKIFQIFVRNFTFRLHSFGLESSGRFYSQVLSVENADYKCEGEGGRVAIVPAARKTVTTSSLDSIMEESLGWENLHNNEL